ncbi:MAG: hypothetical protein S0880_31690 [Actinomycetota bacterium]|nr:hypothetical protein [Actinomycetota bacterium]
MEHRTALATAGSVVGIVVAGITAIGANVGILDSGDDGIGELSAAEITTETTAAPDDDGIPVSTTASSTVDAPVTTAAAPTTAAPTTAAAPVERFTVGPAGTVSVSRSGAALTVTDVGANPGWTASAPEGQGSGEVRVDFVGPTTVRFKAEIEDGVIHTEISSSGGSGRIPGARDDDDDHGGSWTERGEHHEYEGGDDDD